MRIKIADIDQAEAAKVRAADHPLAIPLVIAFHREWKLWRFLRKAALPPRARLPRR